MFHTQVQVLRVWKRIRWDIVAVEMKEMKTLKKALIDY